MTADLRLVQGMDERVGQNIRIVRKLRGMSQQTLAKQIGVSFQQLQKYETGTNRVSAGRLWNIAQQLQIDVECFFIAQIEYMLTAYIDDYYNNKSI